MATKFSPCKGSYVLNQFPSNVMFGMNGFHVSASGAIQGHHGPLVCFCFGGYGGCAVYGPNTQTGPALVKLRTGIHQYLSCCYHITEV